MGDLEHFATRRDLLAVAGGGPPIYSVGRAGSGASYTTIQEGVDACTTDVNAGTVASGVVLVYPGTYLEDVKVRCDGVFLRGEGALGSVVVRSVTWTDATLASLTTFNGNGLKASLVVDPALTHPPLTGGIQNIVPTRDAAAPAWVGLANASLRFLGSPVVGGTFGSGSFYLDDLIIMQANGAAAGTGGIYGTYTGQFSGSDIYATGGFTFDQCAGAAFLETVFKDSQKVDWIYDSTLTKPAAAHAGLALNLVDLKDELRVDGDVAFFAIKNAHVGSIDDNATAAGSTSTAYNSHCNGAIDIANVAATITWHGGEIRQAVTGAGAASFTQDNRVVACETLPDASNTRSLGSSALRLAAAHAQILYARNDDTDTVRSRVQATQLTAKGTNHAINPEKAATDVAGYSESVTGGQSGDASGAAGKVGGRVALTGGQGGAGTAALLAGVGADALLIGGPAGTNGGFGGNNGGAAIVRGGTPTGLGAKGKAIIGDTQTSAIEIGNAADNPGTSFLGTGAVSMGGSLGITGTLTTALRAVTVPGAYPYTVQPGDYHIDATAGAGGVAVNLPAAVAGNVGEEHTVVHYDAGVGAVSVTPNGVDKINGGAGGAAYSLAAQWNSVTLYVAAAGQWVVKAHQ